MAGDESLLEELRAVFAGELADHLETFERSATKLSRPEAAVHELAAEIYRAAHSLKGAARAVGFGEVERVCHRLEDELGPVRRGVEMRAETVKAAVERALGELRAWDEAQRGQPEATSPEPAPAPLPAAEPRASGGETVRVSAERIGAVLRATEALLSQSAEMGAPERSFAGFDETLLELRRRLEIARRRLSDPAQAAEAIDGALGVGQTLALWAADLRRGQRGTAERLARRLSALHGETRALRMIRLDALATTLERACQTAAQAAGKRIDFSFFGGDVEVDRRLVERLRDPLAHIIRNAVDHGIEPDDERRRLGKGTSRISVTAELAGPELIVRVDDDGRGIDEDAVRRAAVAAGLEVSEDVRAADLIFEPGLSTKGEVTETSGRGIGLDVARQRIAELHGRINVEWQRGRGTHFVLAVPGDLSTVRGLVVAAGGQRFVLVETAVERVLRVGADDEQLTEGRRYVRTGDGVLPLADLARTLGLAPRGPRTALRPAVILASGERRVVYLVDDLVEARQVVVKPLGRRVRRAAFVSGATSLGGDELACVLEAAELVEFGRAERADLVQASARPIRRLLVVDDSVTTRQLLSSILEAAGYQVEAAHDGEAAWQRLMAGDTIDLVVSDIEMPRLDGFQLLARLRAASRTAQIPVVLVTALSSDDDRRRALALGADAYVVKGRFDQAALLDAVEELIS